MEKHTPLLDRVVDFSADGRRVIASVVALSLILAGCSDFRERFFSSSPKDHSYAEGGRRAPALNPGGQGVQESAAAAASAPAAPAPAAALTPYDRYHSTPGLQGMHAPQAAAPMPGPSSVPEEKGWFSRWFGDDAPAVAARRRPVENMGQTASATEMPRMEMSAPVEEVSRSTPKPLLEEDGYPDLSAIPPTPARAEQFREDRTATQNKFADMEAEQQRAEARRGSLAAEPGLLPHEAALSAEEELAIAARKESESIRPLPPELPRTATTTTTTSQTAVRTEKKEEGGLFSWMKNPFSSDEKPRDTTPVKTIRAPRELGAAPVMPVETSRPMAMRAPAATLDVPPPPSISDERPILLREPTSLPHYDEVAPGHLRLKPPASVGRSTRVLPPSRYAAKRAQQRVMRGAFEGDDSMIR